MGKRKTDWDEAKIARYIKEGRGKGIGADYKPWLTVQDFPTRGRAHEVKNWKNNRLCNYFSDIENDFALLLLWSDRVVDFQEQYPLIDREDAMKIAESLGIRYPCDIKSKTPLVMTTDFLITLLIDMKEIKIARTVKDIEELNDSKKNKRIADKLEIERQYWKKRNIDWDIVTNKDLPRTLIANIDDLYKAYELHPTSKLTVSDLLKVGALLKEHLSSQSGIIADIAKALDVELSLSPGTSNNMFRYFVIRKEIIVDMNVPVDPSSSTNIIKQIKY